MGNATFKAQPLRDCNHLHPWEGSQSGAAEDLPPVPRRQPRPRRPEL